MVFDKQYLTLKKLHIKNEKPDFLQNHFLNYFNVVNYSNQIHA